MSNKNFSYLVPHLNFWSVLVLLLISTFRMEKNFLLEVSEMLFRTNWEEKEEDPGRYRRSGQGGRTIPSD